MKPKVHVAVIQKRESRKENLTHTDPPQALGTKWHCELHSLCTKGVRQEQ